MVDGQVGFHRPENVRRCKIAKNNTIVRQLEKTKVELHPDLAQEQQARMREIQKQNKAQRILEQKKKKMEELERKREMEERSYDRIVGGETSVSGEFNVVYIFYRVYFYRGQRMNNMTNYPPLTATNLRCFPSRYEWNCRCYCSGGL